MIATPASPFDQFRAAVMADAAAQAYLAEPYDPAIFEARAMEWAATRSITLGPADFREAMAASRTPRLSETWPDEGWLPVRFTAAPEPTLEWLHFSTISPNAPFFDDAASEAAHRPFNRLLRIATPISTGIAPRAPTGLVFHMSRCGSTLVSRMLGAAPGHVSISEASAFDALLRHDFGDSDAHVAALRALAHAWGRGAAQLFLKLDAWHSRALPLLRRAFPDTPWIFLYRDPVEVMVSHQRQRGVHTVPGLIPLDWFGLPSGDSQLPERGFIARVLERICGAVIEHRESEGLLVNYDELPQAFFTRILPHFGVAPDAMARAAMTAAAARNAKSPDNAFRADGPAKQREADAGLREAAAHIVAPVFARLEVLRTAG